MKLFSLFLTLLLICLTFFSTAHAAKVYKHIPFHLKISPEDIIIVNYDFAEKTGIQCSTSVKSANIDFTYRGHDKSASLPAILQSDHIPQKNIEHLADIEGQFKISFNKPQKIYGNNQSLPNKEYDVTCVYLGEKSFE